jgi:hypothetical protein
MNFFLRLLVRSGFSFVSAAIVIVGFTFALGQSMHAQMQTSEAKPIVSTSVEEFGYEAGIHALEAFQLEVNDQLRARHFDELDRLANKLRAGKVRWPGSRWKLSDFYEGLEEPRPGLNPTEEDWKSHLRLLQEWKTAKPQSITVRVAMAAAYIGYGYQARGEGFSDTVSDSGWRLFQERVTKADQILQEAASLREKCPHWYAVLLEVAKADGWPKDKTTALFEKAVGYEPLYYEYYHDLAEYLQPKWHGEPGDTENFAKQSADRLGGDEGDVLYFQLGFSQRCSCKKEPIMKSMSWERIKKGYEASERLYGKSLMRTNHIAYMASKVGDVITADDAFKRMAGRWSEPVWGNEGVFENWRDWVTRMAPQEREEQKFKLELSQNMETPEGKRHGLEIEQVLSKHYGECSSTASESAKVPFRIMIELKADGTPIAMRAEPWTEVWQCLIKFLPMKAGTLSAPPRDKYWFSLDVDPKAISN